MTSDLDVKDLLYSTDEMSVLFVPRALALELIETREQLPECRTWGEARAALRSDRFDELVDELVAPKDQPPADDAPLDLGHLNLHHPWPWIHHSAIEDWVPPDVIEEFGERFDTMMSSGVNLDICRVDELVGRLRAAGYRCEEDGRVENLFGEEH
jgi:hypothetical protein